MKAKIKVGFSARIQAVSFTPVEESDSIEIEVEYTDTDDLQTQIERWQEFVQDRVVEATFEGANRLIEKKGELDGKKEDLNNF